MQLVLWIEEVELRSLSEATDVSDGRPKKIDIDTKEHLIVKSALNRFVHMRGAGRRIDDHCVGPAAVLN